MISTDLLSEKKCRQLRSFLILSSASQTDLAEETFITFSHRLFREKPGVLGSYPDPFLVLIYISRSRDVIERVPGSSVQSKLRSRIVSAESLCERSWILSLQVIYVVIV